MHSYIYYSDTCTYCWVGLLKSHSVTCACLLLGEDFVPTVDWVGLKYHSVTCAYRWVECSLMAMRQCHGGTSAHRWVDVICVHNWVRTHAYHWVRHVVPTARYTWKELTLHGPALLERITCCN